MLASTHRSWKSDVLVLPGQILQERWVGGEVSGVVFISVALHRCRELVYVDSGANSSAWACDIKILSSVHNKFLALHS